MMVYDECSNGATTSDAYAMISDERGSVRLVVRISDSRVVQRTDYGQWGLSAAAILDAGNIYQPIGLAGAIWLPEAALWHFGARDYDAAIGRWTSKDPILFGGGYNLYMYAGNDPVNHTDPSGLILVVGAGVGALADLGGQLLSNGGDWSQVSWGRVALSAAVGAFTGGVGAGLASSELSFGMQVFANFEVGAAASALAWFLGNLWEEECDPTSGVGNAFVWGGLGGAAGTLVSPLVSSPRYARAGSAFARWAGDHPFFQGMGGGIPGTAGDAPGLVMGGYATGGSYVLPLF